ncbi:hypothetical protein U879_19755 [Defluviimonas sp. 20V17]|uniref:STAS/SEC14 domain-containing protein n=1 Tax=Allgaiera indica TaxID=765699 RepID=A0AAN4USX6_9RHOB|nr:STAS/SEC14 domain-containing protein [Allgaiera indica]KDB01948.1 hypothetical protein U879_19755 [Defluviimonas sp. 20V17]GHE03355.1 STAS/SEC14 domain-containing protein [Allgaiera indica]SDX23927.1 SpoIIAA-like [Allgaiera indica]
MTKVGNFEVLGGMPEDVLAIEAKGKITRADYEDFLIPEVSRRIAKQGKVKLLYVLGDDFAGYTAGAAWDDAKLGLLHLGDFARVALVTDIEWIRMGVKMFAPMLRAPVHLYHLGALDEARAWITSDNDDPPHEPQVAADHKLPTLEDKM